MNEPHKVSLPHPPSQPQVPASAAGQPEVPSLAQDRSQAAQTAAQPAASPPAQSQAETLTPAAAQSQTSSELMLKPKPAGRSQGASGVRPRRKRFRTDRITTMWLIVAAILEPLVIWFPSIFPQPLWLGIHVLTLGVILTSILQWSWHFAQGLLHLPPESKAQKQRRTSRVIAIHAALVLLIVATSFANWWLALLAVIAVLYAVLGHALALGYALRTPFAARFTPTMRYPLAGLIFFAAGISLTPLMLAAMWWPGVPAALIEARDRLTLSHAVCNLFGGLGLTITGVLVTLGPTVLRQRAHPRALAWAKCGFLPAVMLVAASALAIGFGQQQLAALSELAYLVTVALAVGAPILALVKKAMPLEISAITMACALTWLTFAFLGIIYSTWQISDPGLLRGECIQFYLVGGIGGGIQLICGALEFLMPATIGGGPKPMKAAMAVMSRLGPARVAARNSALLMAYLISGPTRTACIVIIALSYIQQVVTFVKAAKAQVKARIAIMRGMSGVSGIAGTSGTPGVAGVSDKTGRPVAAGASDKTNPPDAMCVTEAPDATDTQAASSNSEIPDFSAPIPVTLLTKPPLMKDLDS